jgi:hypothetical protein
MADPEEKGLPAETPAETGTPPETSPETPPAANEPDVTPKPEATPAPEGEEPAKPSLDDFSLDEILARADVADKLDKTAQSAKDSATARAETRFEEKARRAQEVAQANVDAEERKKLVASEDFDEIGRQEVAKAEAKERLLESLSQAGEAITQETVRRYTRELGEEAVERIIQEQDAAGGDSITLTKAFAEEATSRAVEKATSNAITEAEKRFEEKLEAYATDGRVKERSEEAATTGPVEKVSGTPPVQKGSEEPETWESKVDKFNAGEISWEEMEPYQKAHDKETGGSGMRG